MYKCVCKKCPAGFFAPPGATQCTTCTATHQFDITLCDGTTKCTPVCTSSNGTACGARGLSSGRIPRLMRFHPCAQRHATWVDALDAKRWECPHMTPPWLHRSIRMHPGAAQQSAPTMYEAHVASVSQGFEVHREAKSASYCVLALQCHARSTSPAAAGGAKTRSRCGCEPQLVMHTSDAALRDSLPASQRWARRA